MIKKLEYKSVEDVKKELDDSGFGLFSTIIDVPVPPSDEEIINKINEIIDYINGVK